MQVFKIKKLLHSAGRVSADQAEKKAIKEYENIV